MSAARSPALAAIVAALMLAACGSDPPSRRTETSSADGGRVAASGATGDRPRRRRRLRAAIDPADFSDVVDNPFMPLLPTVALTTPDGGSRSSSRCSTSGDGDGRVATIVVHDVASVDGEVVEDTYDWFAQDSAGNVWYFGEDTTAYDDAGTASHEGAWEAGVGGALPGVVMAASPR